MNWRIGGGTSRVEGGTIEVEGGEENVEGEKETEDRCAFATVVVFSVSFEGESAVDDDNDADESAGTVERGTPAAGVVEKEEEGKVLLSGRCFEETFPIWCVVSESFSVAISKRAIYGDASFGSLFFWSGYWRWLSGW